MGNGCPLIKLLVISVIGTNNILYVRKFDESTWCYSCSLGVNAVSW